jgi:CHAT domain-containing protein/tetratricopeptide (TPR) repeat protein
MAYPRATMRIPLVTPVRTLCVVALAMLLGSAAVGGQRIGLDIEDFNPPYTRSDPLVVQALAAYDAEHDSDAERLSRQLLALSLARKSESALSQVEAHFILARVLDSEHRLTEAETEYRQGLKLLEPLVGPDAAQKLHDPKAAADALRWARYFQILLHDNLRGQGRLREANLLPSILPSGPADTGPHNTESGVSWVGPIALSPCPGGAPAIRALNPTESAQREQWDEDAIKRANANDPAGAETDLRGMLALDIQSFGPTHCETAVEHRRIAQVLLDQNRLADAEAEARQALTILDQVKEDHRQAVYALGALAEVTSRQRGASEAEPYLRRALEIFERRLGADRQETLSARLALAANLYAQGRLADSEGLYRKALAGILASYGGSQTMVLEIEEFTGYLAGRQGKFAEAVNDYRTACAQRAELIARGGRGVAASLLKTSDQAEAGNCALRQSFALWRWAEAGGGPLAADHPDALRDEAFEAAQSALPSPSGDTLARAAARIVAISSGAGDLAERYEAAIRGRDAAGDAPTPIWHDPFTETAPPADREAERESRNQEIAKIASRLAHDAPLYWDIRMPRPLGVAALQTGNGTGKPLLRKDEALVFLMVPHGEKYGLVFAVSKDRAGWARIGMTGADLKRKIGALRGGIDGKAYGLTPRMRAGGADSVAFDRALANQLYQALFGGPEIQAVIADRKTLIIVPTGPLTTLPPGLLVTRPPAGGAAGDDDAGTMRRTDWLLRTKAIALLPSVASLRTIRQIIPHRRDAVSQPLLAFTDPDFSGQGTAPDANSPIGKRRAPDNFTTYFRGGKPVMAALRTLPPLPFTRDEGRALAAALGTTPESVLTGADATKAELMKRSRDGRLGHVRVLEFATHGLVAGDGDGLAEPALVLAAGSRPEDLLLTASDAATLRLNADWVLLSACNTGSPDAQDAEGLSGLVKGFFYAGSSAVLVSHWTIADDTSAILVPMTIRLNYGQGLSKAEALRRASLAILDDPRRDQTHPVYWAPFTLIGDPQ